MRFVTRSALAASAAIAFAAASAVAVATAPAARAATCSVVNAGATSNGTTVVVSGSCTSSSSSGGGGGGGGGGWSPPPCWLAPKYSGKALYDNFHGGVDNIGFLAIPRPSQDPANYKDTPPSQDVWWVPVSDGTPAGDACAYGLYWPEWAPPPQSGGPAGYPIMNTKQASAMALKSLQLPPLNVQLHPDGTTFVNLPTYVTAQYDPQVSATATISIPMEGIPGSPFTVSATVTATVVGGLKISVPAGVGVAVSRGCGDLGSAAQGNGLTCGVRFTKPSGSTKFPVTISTTWRVRGPGVPAGTIRTATQIVQATVNEIQSQNG